MSRTNANEKAGTDETPLASGWTRRRITLMGSILFTVLVTIIILSGVWNVKDSVDNADAGLYSYHSYHASNGMELHVLKTKPQYISIQAIHDNVTKSALTGINGGFFYESAQLSLAMMNGAPINGAAGAYGSGDQNVKYARGTLVWDGVTNQLKVQVIRRGDEVQVQNPKQSWAQGGISMDLSSEASWRQRILDEKAPFPDDHRLRSGAV
ncbi:hypothetical protein, partial [Paenibacillus sp. 1001270B_150601_E10]|uniref:hypothetical protein n=1 Tax=Paenibacillus sp. 1001270B_150601_E10 TaxID=2787079 RepID=UPI00189E5317